MFFDNNLKRELDIDASDCSQKYRSLEVCGVESYLVVPSKIFAIGGNNHTKKSGVYLHHTPVQLVLLPLLLTIANNSTALRRWNYEEKTKLEARYSEL